MRAYNFAPLWRSTIGYDHFLDLCDAAQHTEGEDHYPPYNIERQSEDHYQISLVSTTASENSRWSTADQAREGNSGDHDIPPLHLVQPRPKSVNGLCQSGARRTYFLGVFR